MSTLMQVFNTKASKVGSSLNRERMYQRGGMELIFKKMDKVYRQHRDDRIRKTLLIVPVLW